MASLLDPDAESWRFHPRFYAIVGLQCGNDLPELASRIPSSWALARAGAGVGGYCSVVHLPSQTPTMTWGLFAALSTLCLHRVCIVCGHRVQLVPAFRATLCSDLAHDLDWKMNVCMIHQKLRFAGLVTTVCMRASKLRVATPGSALLFSFLACFEIWLPSVSVVFRSSQLGTERQKQQRELRFTLLRLSFPLAHCIVNGERKLRTLLNVCTFT